MKRAWIAFFLTACLSSERPSFQPAPGMDDANERPEGPSETVNYFQRGSEKTTTSLQLPHDFNDHFLLKGRQVHRWIERQPDQVQCLVSVFERSRIVFVMAAAPQMDPAGNFREFYYLLKPNQTDANRAHCQRTGLLTTLEILHPKKRVTYSLETVCPDCRQISSTGETLFSPDGQPLSDHINLNNLHINLTSLEDLTGPSCTPAQCQAQGADCCSHGQCVKNLQPKNRVDTSGDEYAQAMADIKLNPAHIYNYPQFFHLCSNLPTSQTAKPSRVNPHLSASRHFLKLERLHQCTTPFEGEMARCSVSYQKIGSQASGQFKTGADDRNFNTLYRGTRTLNNHSIYRVVHAGEKLFDNNRIIKGMSIAPKSGNDNLTDWQTIRVSHKAGRLAPDDDLVITYKVDGSCEKVTPHFAKCEKHYVQGQNLGRVDDHYPAANAFRLPHYADTSRTVGVKVDGINRLRGLHWDLLTAAPVRIEFKGPDLKVRDTQKVVVGFYVDLQDHPNVLLKKQQALETIKAYCQCVDTRCRLEPKLDKHDKIVNYVCKHPPGPLANQPLDEIVLLDAKSAPHRYFDTAGVYHKKIKAGTPKQEGNAFEYIDNNLLKPNNVKQYVGFNEIYGSMASDEISAQPAQELEVRKNRTYDIYTDDGTFSTCYFCGTDYYSQLLGVFPESFLNRGGGYRPATGNNPFTSPLYRKDDLLFGRACWVPATMIPWSHIGKSNVQQQRLSRLNAQHFFFANGYQRDWYGFDYGSVIGSWDGVSWFSIGNQRRVKAKSNKLFLAVNAYFGDLTRKNFFRPFGGQRYRKRRGRMPKAPLVQNRP